MSGGTHSKGSTATKRHVLFAILDWGLGHATRSWPLIVQSRRSGADVTVASRGAAAAWLQNRMNAIVAQEQRESATEVPPWLCLEKPGVHIRYAKGHLTLPQIALQMPAFLRSIAQERRWIKSLMEHTAITHVISDNCYGAHPPSHDVPSALITHQASPPVPAFFQGMAKAQVSRWMEAFEEVWIPDTDQRALAGELSLPTIAHHRFIGPLSRFSVDDGTGESEAEPPSLVGIVSGPEPQRSLMEAALLQCFARDGRKAVVFSGDPNGAPKTVKNVELLPNPSDGRIRHALTHADCIVCRSGYSSLMDLTVLGLKAILVPTPGQPEQEYLAELWHKQWGWHRIHQHQLAEFQPPPHLEGQTVPLSEVHHGRPDWMQHWLSPSQHPAARTA